MRKIFQISVEGSQKKKNENFCLKIAKKVKFLSKEHGKPQISDKGSTKNVNYVKELLREREFRQRIAEGMQIMSKYHMHRKMVEFRRKIVKENLISSKDRRKNA